MLFRSRFASVAARSRHVAERRTAISEALACWESKTILERLDANGVPCAPVVTRTELLENEQVRVNRVIEVHEHAALGKVRQPRPAALFERTPAQIRTLAPFLGEHNAQILSELGYSAAETKRLAAGGVLAGQGGK